jgi:hypothetical protein
MNIKAVMNSDTIPNQTNKEMSATEIAARTNRLNVTNNNMVVVAQKMLTDDVKWLLHEFAKIEGFYPEGFDLESYINGVQVTLTSTEVKNMEQIQAIATMIDLFNVATPDGSMAAVALNKPEYANKIAELLRVPQDIVLPQNDIKANMEAAAQAQIQQETEKQKAEMIRELIVNASKQGGMPGQTPAM